MKKLIILFIICFFSWINLHASTLVSDSIIAESIQKEIIECMTTINDRTDFNTDSSLRKTIKTAKRLNDLVNKYYVITNDSTVFSCTFVGELITAAIYDSHKLIDSAYVHCKRACQLYEPYGRMACSADSTKQFSRMFFGNDGIYSIMRDWNVKQKKYEEAIRYGTIIIDSCQAQRADLDVVRSLLRQGEIYEEMGDYKKSIESQIQARDKRLSYANFGESPLASQIYVGIMETIEKLVEKEKFLVNKQSIEWVYSDSVFSSSINDLFTLHHFFWGEEEKNGKTFWLIRLFNTIIRIGETLKLYNDIYTLEEGFGNFLIRNYGKESTEYAEYLSDYSNLYNSYLNELDSDIKKEKYIIIANEKENQAIEIWKRYFKQNTIDEIVSNYQKIEKEYASQNEKKQETANEKIRLYSILNSYSMYLYHIYSLSLKENNFDMAYNAVSKRIDFEENVLKKTADAILYSMLGNVCIVKRDFINAEKNYNRYYLLAREKQDTLGMANANLILFKLYAYPFNNQAKARGKLSEAYKLVTEYSCHSIQKSWILEEMAVFYKSIYNYNFAYHLICQSHLEKLYCGYKLSDDDYLKEADFIENRLTTDSVLFSHIQEIAGKTDLSKQVQKASELLALNYSVYLNNYAKGIYYYQKASNIAHELNNNISEAKNIAAIGSIYFLRKRYDNALEYMKKAEKINPNLKYDDLLTLMAHINNDSIVKCRLPFLYDYTTNWLKKQILSTNNIGREMLVRKMPYDVLKSMTYYYPNLPICADIAYNSTLLYKGLLRNTQKTISEYIANSNDKGLKEQYAKLLMNYCKEGKTESIFEESTQSQIETSELEMTILESLSKKKVLADLEITWNKICEKLNKNDVAIEFVEISKLELLDRSAICYGALILRRGYKHPVFIELDSKNEIDKDINALLNSFNTVSRLTTKWKTVSGHLYKKIWGKLEDYIHSGENVYFSTDGLLHKTPIEFLSDSLGNYANEKYNMFRLSSTRELCKKHKEGISKAVLYGGLLYDAETKGEEVDSLDSFQFYDDTSTRSGWNYLPASETEVDSISSQLSSKGVPIIKRKGLDGTEESFKELSGLDLSVVHIATHGFYFPQKEARYIDYYQSQIDISPMKRSGLMMTGGQTAWMGKKSIEQEHDGILTSEEISNIDLSNVSLVVLSACQTGLGDIDSGAEGVIGIQRAFKLAGVQSLLMSLWKVDDEATSYMMQKFYSRILAGDTKHNAFKTAQKEVRNKYANPYYWAGFIMLD